MATIDDVLVRMKTMPVQASSDNLSDTERGFLNDEFTELRDEIDRIASSTNFNGIQLLGDGGNVAIEFGDLATSQGDEDLVPAFGFDGFAITDNNYWATDANTDLTDSESSVDINYAAGGRVIITVSSTIDGSGANDRTQSIDVTDYATSGAMAISPGENATLNFDELDLSFTVNTNFASTVATISGHASGDSNFRSGTDFGGGGVDVSNTTVTMAADSGQQLATNIELQVGGGNIANDRLSIDLTSVDSSALGTGGTGQESLDDLGTNAIATAGGAQNAVEVVTRAIDDLQRARAAVGTSQNRLDFAGQNLALTQENTESARSTLLDLDVAAEMTAFSSKQILVQSGVAMLAQANQMPQNLLRLLQ